MVHELAEGDLVAQHVRFELRHTGNYYELEATGRAAVLAGMIFHRFDAGDLIAESWRMT